MDSREKEKEANITRKEEDGERKKGVGSEDGKQRSSKRNLAGKEERDTLE